MGLRSGISGRAGLGGTVWMGVAAAVLGMATAQRVEAQGMDGTWRTATGSVVQVYGCGGAVCLKILQVEKSAPGTEDHNNPNPALRSRSLCGLEIGSGFQPKDGGAAAEDGTLYDPESGKTYKGAIALDGKDKLKLRGYVGMKMFGRTEVWTRYTGATNGCRAQ